MIAGLRSLKKRIKSVENTRKITHAMEMVSSSKLNRVRSPLFSARSYFSRMESILIHLLSDDRPSSHPFLKKREDIARVALCVITSDAGLCSVYNYAIIRVAEEFIDSRGRDNVILVTVGREGYNYFKRQGYNIADSYVELYGRYSDASADAMTDKLAGLFTDGAISEAHVAYTDFSTNLHQKPKIEMLLPVNWGQTPIFPQKDGRKIGVCPQFQYIIEPDFENVLDFLINEYIYTKLRVMLLSAFTSEHASRMIAMKMATDNAQDLIETLTLLRNKARQAEITKEVLEVAMSAEALKG